MGDNRALISNTMYNAGYINGVRDGKTEILDDLMNTAFMRRTNSEVVSCTTLIELLKSRKEMVEKLN